MIGLDWNTFYYTETITHQELRYFINLIALQYISVAHILDSPVHLPSSPRENDSRWPDEILE